MEMEAACARLAHYQMQIGAALDGVGPILQQPEATRFKALALSRWHLLRILREYQLFKHTEIFDPVIAGASGLQSETAKLLKSRCIAIGEAYHEHVRRWSIEGAVNGWERYTADATEMRSRIDQHLERERRDVPLLLKDMRRTQELLSR